MDVQEGGFALHSDPTRPAAVKPSQRGGFTGYASAADPNPRFLQGQMPGGSDTSLESQIAASRLRLQLGSSGCSLEAQIAGWRLGLQLGGSAGWPFGTPGCHLELHRWPFAAPGGHLELQDVI